MNEITIGICEDTIEDLNLLIQHLKKIAADMKLRFNIRTFSSGKELLNKYTPDYDLIFLDVELPDLSGDSVAAEIRKCDKYVYLVFTSKYTNYISIGYKHEAHNYLLKPLKHSHVQYEVENFLRHSPILNKPYLWLNDKHKIQKIYFSKLRYIETGDRIIILHYENDVIRHRSGITNFMKELPKHTFFRCNHSYIVNLEYVDYIAPDINRFSIHLITGETLPLSRDRKKEFLLELQKAGEQLC